MGDVVIGDTYSGKVVMKKCDLCHDSIPTDGEYRLFTFSNDKPVRLFCCFGHLMKWNLLNPDLVDEVTNV